MENSFKSIIEESRSILILLPTKPYFDQVAAGLSLYLIFRGQRETQISCPTPMTVEFNRLIGVNKITQELGNKNLIIRFADYRASDIERVSYDIENGQFKLSVIPKDRIVPPQKDQIDISYSGVTADTVILIGGTNDSHFPVISSKELVGAKLIHIGIKDITLSGGKSLISFSRPASSISEVIADLIKESALNIDEDTATNLLLGIEDGSHALSDSGVSAETFEIIAGLMRVGGKISSQMPVARGNFPPGAIPGVMPKVNPVQIPLQQPSSLQTTGAQQTSQPLQTSAQGKQATQSIDDTDIQEDAPKDWLEPKIYKGTSVS